MTPEQRATRDRRRRGAPSVAQAAETRRGSRPTVCRQCGFRWAEARVAWDGERFTLLPPHRSELCGPCAAAPAPADPALFDEA